MNIIYYLSFLIGLTLLCCCANSLVDYSISFAKRFNLSKVFIGVVIIGFGSSLPEVLSASVATQSGHSDLAIATIIGSNVANVGLPLALCLIIAKTWPDMTKDKLDISFMVAAYIILFTIFFSTNTITATHGILMLILFGVYIIISLKSSKNNHKTAAGLSEEIPSQYSLFEEMMGITFGLIGVAVGADLLIDGATTIARDFNIPERIIGITMMALGTSLPELAASIAAAKRNEARMVLGNIVGSNMINILAGLGIASTFSSLRLGTFNQDELFFIITALLLIPFFFTAAGRNKTYGFGLISMYSFYIITTIL